MSRPLLVIDGDSFAHRAYHALPKSIRRKGNKGAGAIVGFGNFLLRLYESEQPRAVVVGWDTLDAPTHRQKLFAGYQVGRSFDDELIEQLGVLPEFVAACGFSNAKAPGFEADDFLAAAVAQEERRGRPVVVASGDREPARIRAHHDPAADPCRGDGTHWSSARAQALRCGRSPPRTCYGSIAHWNRPCCPAGSPFKPKSCASIGRLPPWTPQRRCRRCEARSRSGRRERSSLANGS
jgi:hypothetical protein